MAAVEKYKARRTSTFDRKDDQLYGMFWGAVSNNSPLHSIGGRVNTPTIGYGMKNYIRGAQRQYSTRRAPGKAPDPSQVEKGKNVPTAFEYIVSKLKAAASGSFQDNGSLADLSAALHTLEDYFAHSNYTEVALIKSVEVSARLAIHAVRDVAASIFKAWRIGSKDPGEAIAKIKQYLRHPIETSWQEPIVIKWSGEPGSREKICAACSPSVIIDSIVHMTAHMRDIVKVARALANQVDEIDPVVTRYNEYVGEGSEYAVDAQVLKDNIEYVARNCEELEANVRLVRAEWEEEFPRPEDCGQPQYGDHIIHTVSKHETLSLIAREYGGVTVPELCELNNIPWANRDTIYPGQKIKVPRADPHHH